ncbi:MAG: acyl-CoA dehydrogenase family protein [Microthrixaceae bacterium]
MLIAYTPEQEALRTELRAYFTEIMAEPAVADAVAEGDFGNEACLRAIRRMGADGWLGIGWPTEYGGQGRGPVEQFIFIDESWATQAPVPHLTISTVAKTIMAFGSAEQKDFFLPPIVRGECHFAIGYTEPSAGTDLASLTTKAVRDGDQWVITGQKIYTSWAGFADYIWLAARTDPDVPKHQGITIFAVPTTSEGFSCTGISTILKSGTTNTFFDEVRVPADAVIGGVNQGWKLITNQLNLERMAIAPPGMVELPLELVVTWARETALPDGRRVIDLPWVQADLARVRAKLEALKLMNYEVIAAENLSAGAASATKAYGTEFFTEAYGLMLGVMGQAGTLRRGSKGAVLAARLERACQGTLFLTFGGGTNEVQRDMVALFSLGMPRVPRM